MSYSGVLCLLGIRKVAQELRSEAVEVVQDVPPMFGQFEQFGYGILMEFHGFWVIQLRNQFMRTL